MRIVNLLLKLKRPISEHDAEILAWVIAAEGSITLTKSKCPTCKLGFGLQPRIKVGTNTSFKFIKKLNKIVDAALLYQKPRLDKNANAMYECVVYGQKDIKYLLEKIIPYLPSKKKIAELLLEFCNSRLEKLSKCKNRNQANFSKREIEIFEEMRRLNKHGLNT